MAQKKVVKFPPLVESTRDWAQQGGAGGGAPTDIEQIDKSLLPSFDSPVLELLIKGIVEPEIEADISYLVAEGVENGEIDFGEITQDGTSFATVFTLAKTANSYALAGIGRKQVVDVLSATGGAARRGFKRMFGRGGYDSGGGFDE